MHPVRFSGFVQFLATAILGITYFMADLWFAPIAAFFLAILACCPFLLALVNVLKTSQSLIVHTGYSRLRQFKFVLVFTALALLQWCLGCVIANSIIFGQTLTNTTNHDGVAIVGLASIASFVGLIYLSNQFERDAVFG